MESSTISFRNYEFQDYELLKQWWASWGWSAPNIDILPLTGIVVEINNKPVAAGFVYVHQYAKIGFLEWLISDPSYKGSAILRLVQRLVEMGQREGADLLITTYDKNQPNSEKLGKLYKLAGLQEVASDCVMMAAGKELGCLLGEEKYGNEETETKDVGSNNEGCRTHCRAGSLQCNAAGSKE